MKNFHACDIIFRHHADPYIIRPIIKTTDYMDIAKFLS